MTTVQRSNMTQTDSKGKVLREPRNNATEMAVNFRWWDLEEDVSIAQAIAATLKFIQHHQGSRLDQLAVSSRLYGMSGIYNLIGTAFARASTINSSPVSQRISFNLCESIIDTLESKMAKNKVIPTYITNGGVWKEQRKAKDLTKFTQGLFYQENIHKKAIHCWCDAAVWGDGFIYVYENNDKVCMERVLPHEIFVDTIETAYGEPHQLHRVKTVDRDIAREMFPELENEINTVSPATSQDTGGQGTAVDLINVVESWHLKSGPDAKDGLHVISVGDGAIIEDYEEDYFPFCHLRYARRKIGWYGQWACERLQTIQGEINRCMILKQKSLWMQGSFKVLVENGSKVVSQHLNNDVGTIINYTGTPPQYVAPPATNPELQQWIDALINYGYQQEGVSKMTSTGEVPLGVESGKAMRTLTQVSDDRFLFMQQEMEDFCLDIAKKSINLVKKIYARTKKYEVIFPTTRFMETVDWGSINLDEDQYVLKAYPTSSLSDDLTGRLSEIQELVQAGMITPRTAKRLMDMPDVEMNDNLSNAAEDMLHKIFEDMLEDGKYRAPEPFFDLQLAKQLVNEYYNYADFMNAPEDRLALLQQFNSQVNDMVAAAQPPMPPAAAPGQPAMQPQATPEATPTSNLIPNVAGVQ